MRSTLHPRFAGLFAASCLLAACAAAVPATADREEITFSSNGARLSGTIVFPSSGPIVASVVFVHGSGPQRRDLALAERFAAHGIAALVYDKRGVGRSQGTFVGRGAFSERNLRLLADDAAAALAVLSAHPRLSRVPAGLVGLSQAGWIVPLAAASSRSAAFVGLWSGCVCRVSEEDIYSQYTSDRDFADPPAFDQVVRWRRQRYVWSNEFGRDTDAAEILRRLTIRGLWIYGANDGSIPVDLSIRNLRELSRARPGQYAYALFSGLGHATIDGTFAAMADWIRRTAADGKTRLRAATTRMTGADLERYRGVYVSTSPAIEILVARRDTTLTIESRGERMDLVHLGGDSFLGHEVGKGFFFLDFDPAAGRIAVSEQGFMYSMQRR